MTKTLRSSEGRLVRRASKKRNPFKVYPTFEVNNVYRITEGSRGDDRVGEETWTSRSFYRYVDDPFINETYVS